MQKDLRDKTLALVHVVGFVIQSVESFVDEIVPDVKVLHFADDFFQRDNVAAEVGTIPKQCYFRFATYCKFMQDAGADLIMLTCSTFNRAVEHARPMIDTPLLQIDRPMMDLAVRQGNRIGLIATLPSTVPSSERLLREAAAEAGKEVEIKTILQSEAFKALRSGNPEKHNEILLAEIDKLSSQVDAIVLAQASMSVLEPHLSDTRVPVYNSVRTGFERARELLAAL